MDVRAYVHSETVRQGGTEDEAAGMYRAWGYFAQLWPFVLVTDDAVRAVSYINGVTGYRQVPVVFRSGGRAAEHAVIPRLMSQLFVHGQDLTPDEFTKEFLDIHPFTDGNGRVGSLIWNYLRGSIMDPEPMPYFYGDDNG